MADNKITDKRKLLALCQSGDREAQGLLYTTYRRKMLKIIRQYVADSDMAQDVLHDGFLIILSQIQSLRNPDSLDYWMATIMKNLAIHTVSQIKFDDILAEQDEEIEDEEYSEISYDELITLINQLPNGYRTVFRLAVLEGKSHKEIAEMLGISPKSSASQLARAKEKLRQLVNEHRKMAGFMGLLLFVAFSTYVFFTNKDMNEAMPSTTIVQNGRQQQKTHQTENNNMANKVKEYFTQTSTANNNVVISSVDTIRIAADVPSDDVLVNSPADSSRQVEDTAKVVPQNVIPREPFFAETDVEPIIHPHRDTWKVNISTNAMGFGSSTNNIVNNGIMADQDNSGNQGGGSAEETTSVRHLMPITFGVRVSKELSPKWAIETGVQYSLLRSEITNTINDWSCIRTVRAHYISIPVVAKYQFLQWKHANMYALGGLNLDIPAGATIESEVISEHSKLNYPVSFSLDTGIGFEYQLSPSTSFFIQPSLNYHLMKHSEHPILWQDQPLSFDLPIGIRISW